MTNDKTKTASFNEIQGIASINVPAYSNEYDDYISFEGCYIHGIYTGYKWQCVEYARRWLLLRKSCIFQDIGSAAAMWEELKYVERVTDGRRFSIKTYSNGCSNKPSCGSFLMYPRGTEIPFGHIAVICEVQEDFIRVAEQNYRSHYWPGNYSRQISMVKRDDLYYIDDYYDVYGWMEIENNDQLTPFNPLKPILEKYRQSKSIGKLECCLISNKTQDDRVMKSKDKDRLYYKIDEDFLLNLSSISNELYQLFIQATENVISNDELLIGFGIPKSFWSRIRQSWIDERNFDIIDQLHLKFNGTKIKLCHYKIENSLSIVESASIQEEKVQNMKLDYNFTSSFQLHRLLVRNWKRLNINTTVHILIDNNQKQFNTELYMKKVMTEAGIDSKLCIFPDDLHWQNSNIVDKDDKIVEIVWKIWNWEIIFQEYNNSDEEENKCNHQHPCLYDILLNQKIRIIEPIWKSIISHTILLPVIYTMYPSHLNILQDELILSEDSNQMPFLNRSMDIQNNENVILYDSKDSFSIDGYLNYNYIPQEFYSDEKNNNHSDKTIVSWMINRIFSGFSICDDQNQITDANNSLTYCCVI